MAKVLLVEDDQFIIKMYKKKFELAGFEVETAVDGEDGLRKLKVFRPDLVCLDFVMPKLDGIKVLEKIRGENEYADFKKLPVVMLTNLSSEIDTDLAIKKGATAYFVKSDLTPAEVVEKIKPYLS